MADLSPAAQAVLDAYSKAMIHWYNSAPPLHERPVGAHPHRSSMAAALRAATEQVVPYESAAPWNEMKCDYDGDHWEMRQWVREKLLAIAAELEGEIK